MAGLALLGFISVYVNNHPFWWRRCEKILVTVEDATGLKAKIPVKSLGLDIGYIQQVYLANDGVKIQICVTAPIEVTVNTRAFVRSEGFLGDRFIELKPVVYLGEFEKLKVSIPEASPSEVDLTLPQSVPTVTPSPVDKSKTKSQSTVGPYLLKAAFFKSLSILDQALGLGSTAWAQSSSTGGKEVPVGGKSADVQQVMNQVNSLMTEVKSITTSLKEAIRPEEIRSAVQQLNKTLENAGKIISPEGSLSSTAKRSLLKLEDAIDQLRDQMTKINQGQGSLGKLLNDPVYADELKKALENMNHFLNRAKEIRLNILLGVQQLPAHLGSRGVFELSIWPKPDRYYKVGMATDPRGSISQVTTITQVAGVSNTVQSTQVDRGGLAVTAMVGKIFYNRLDLSMGMTYGDGTASVGLNLGPADSVESIQFKNDLFFRPNNQVGNWSVRPDFRSYLILQPFSILYLDGGIEGLREVNGKMSFLFGGGLRFDDDDIKLLFSFL